MFRILRLQHKLWKSQTNSKQALELTKAHFTLAGQSFWQGWKLYNLLSTFNIIFKSHENESVSPKQAFFFIKISLKLFSAKSNFVSAEKKPKKMMTKFFGEEKYVFFAFSNLQLGESFNFSYLEMAKQPSLTLFSPLPWLMSLLWVLSLLCSTLPSWLLSSLLQL